MSNQNQEPIIDSDDDDFPPPSPHEALDALAEHYELDEFASEGGPDVEGS